MRAQKVFGCYYIRRRPFITAKVGVEVWQTKCSILLYDYINEKNCEKYFLEIDLATRII